jgi:hypothetical protein
MNQNYSVRVISRGACITAIGFRVAVIPTVGVVTVVMVGVIFAPIARIFNLLDQPGDIVSGHDPPVILGCSI